MNVLNGHHMLLSVYSLNFCLNYGTMVNGVQVELWHNVQWSYGTIEIELRYSTRVMLEFPVVLWYDGDRVAVVYKSNGTISSGGMA